MGYLTIKINHQLTELKKVARELDAFFVQQKIASDVLAELQLIAEEVVTNIIHYGCHSNNKRPIEIEVKLQQPTISIVFRDSSMPFNPLLEAPIITKLPMGLATSGGLGVALIKALTDSQRYRYEQGWNIFEISKNVSTIE